MLRDTPEEADTRLCSTMPLYGKHPFIRQKPPADLKPNDEVFFCKITNEGFRDYE